MATRDEPPEKRSKTVNGCSEGPSTSSGPQNDAEAVQAAAVPTVPKRLKPFKYAMLLSYCGDKFYGMQIQQCEGEFPTIEQRLFQALVAANLVTPEEIKKPGHNFYFQRAARTDKGVSAVHQICSMRLTLDPDTIPSIVKSLNDSLPPDIRVFGLQRVTKNFDAKRDCSGRTYSYTLPTYSFAKTDELTTEAFRLTDDRRKEIGDVLKLFCGTHNFFNFTSNRPHSDRSCARFIVDFWVGDPVDRDGVEFVTLYVKGQSFMLNQIRKMVGMAIAIVRGLTNASTIEMAWGAVRLDIPIAPGLGLLLENVHYDWYDDKFGALHGDLKWTAQEAELTKFRDDKIYGSIVDTERTQRPMLEWLSTLTLHGYEYRESCFLVPLLRTLVRRRLIRLGIKGRTIKELEGKGDGGKVDFTENSGVVGLETKVGS